MNDSTDRPPATEPPNTPLLSYSLAELLLGLTMAAILATLFGYSSDLGVLAAVIAAPVSLRTFLVLRRRAKLGQLTTKKQRIGLFFASLAVATTMLASTTIALGLAIFFAIGLACSGAGVGAWIVWLVSLIAAACCVFICFPLWIRRRWLRDIGLSRELHRKASNNPHRKDRLDL
ncbi:MAG: hypothetical protein ACR2NU_04520 [Aeoliella sp.]